MYSQEAFWRQFILYGVAVKTASIITLLLFIQKFWKPYLYFSTCVAIIHHIWTINDLETYWNHSLFISWHSWIFHTWNLILCNFPNWIWSNFWCIYFTHHSNSYRLLSFFTWNHRYMNPKITVINLRFIHIYICTCMRIAI